jgi:phage terminase small subunit
MGRPPKPTKLLEMSGAVKKNPQRYAARKREPQPGDVLGPPPPHFLIQEPATGFQRAARLRGIWDELVAQVPAGVLTSADAWLVECACYLMEKRRYQAGDFKSGDQAQLTGLLGKMGMTPVDRARMAGTTADPGDSFDKFMRSG